METLPYGSWPSPISAALTQEAGVGFPDIIASDGDDLYWVESRPAEGGRSALVRRSAAGAIEDVGPDDFNARTGVHEYGGGAYAVSAGVAFVSSFEDQRIYRIDPGSEPTAITPEPPQPRSLRYADLTVRNDWAIGVRESHGEGEPTNELVRIDLTGASEPEVVASGHDFFAAPRISPDGTRIAWLTWDHPNMPWDGSDLWAAPISPTGDVGDPVHVAGGLRESIFQAEWSPDGELYFSSDRSGWWNLYRVGATGIEPIFIADTDIGTGAWTFGRRRFIFLDDGRLVASMGADHGATVAVIDSGGATEVATFASLGPWMAVSGSTVYLVSYQPDSPTAIVSVDVDTGAVDVVRAPAGPDIGPEWISPMEPITFDTPDGPAHAYYYPPANPECRGPDDAAPPLIVDIHGGPTSAAAPDFDVERLFWTSRGFGVVDVNYGGSTGHGRAYRERLNGRWGVVDVRDCALAAAHLAREGRADPDRLLIHGGSAGGFTTLLALAIRDEFAAGTSRYGVADLAALAEHTHKFESRYLDSLVGPYPEDEATYTERSPMTHIDSLDRPVLLLQGTEDFVVPQEQSDMIFDALRDRGVPVAYLLFEGEGHGFRKAENRITALEAELAFYGRVLGFDVADDLPGLEIHNL